jgi:hypothetical protein
MLATIQFRIFCLSVCCLKTKVKIYKTVTVPLVLHGRDIFSLILREEHRLRVFENRVLRKIFELRGMKFQDNGEICILRSFIICALHEILLGSNQGR